MSQVARLIEILTGIRQRANSFFAVMGGEWPAFEEVDEALVLLDELGFPPTTSRRLKAVLRRNHRFSPSYRRQRCDEVVGGLIARLRSVPPFADGDPTLPTSGGQRGAGAGNRSAKKPGRPRKSKFDRVDLVVAKIIRTGKADAFRPSWKDLLNQYSGDLPKNYKADTLRNRVRREQRRRASDGVDAK